MPFVRTVTLVASTVSTFTFTGAAANASGFEVRNLNGAGEVYISHDGTTTPTDPTVGGNDFDVVEAAVGAGAQIRRSTSTQGPVTVKLISAAATKVSVRSLA